MINRQRHLQLNAGIELLKGLNGILLLYIGQHKRYMHLSPLGAQIIRLLEEQSNSSEQPGVTNSYICEMLAEQFPSSQSVILQAVDHFIKQLTDAGVLAPPSDDIAVEGQKKNAILKQVGRKINRGSILKVGLWRPNRTIANRKVSWVCNRAGIAMLLRVWFLLALATVGYTLMQRGADLNFQLVEWPLILGCYVLHIGGHELSHALASSYFGVPIREIGVGLLYYFIPVGYTDRTDSYRIQNSKPLAYIALAGPAFDLSAAAISAIVAYVTAGWLSATFHLLLLLQTMAFIGNLNPLLPSDGYHIAETLLGKAHFRGRAFSLILHWIIGKEPPPYLRGLTARERVFYFTYGLASLAYIALLILPMIRLILILIFRTTRAVLV